MCDLDDLSLADPVQPFASVYEYVMVCTPVPAADGSKMPPLTNAPLYAPPGGEPPVSVTGFASAHTSAKLPSVTFGLASTVTDTVVTALHPVPLLAVIVYVIELAGVAVTDEPTVDDKPVEGDQV